MRAFQEHQHQAAMRHLEQLRRVSDKRLQQGDPDPEHRIAKVFAAADSLLEVEAEIDVVEVLTED